MLKSRLSIPDLHASRFIYSAMNAIKAGMLVQVKRSKAKQAELPEVVYSRGKIPDTSCRMLACVPPRGSLRAPMSSDKLTVSTSVFRAHCEHQCLQRSSLGMLVSSERFLQQPDCGWGMLTVCFCAGVAVFSQMVPVSQPIRDVHLIEIWLSTILHWLNLAFGCNSLAFIERND